MKISIITYGIGNNLKMRHVLKALFKETVSIENVLYFTSYNEVHMQLITPAKNSRLYDTSLLCRLPIRLTEDKTLECCIDKR